MKPHRKGPEGSGLDQLRGTFAPSRSKSIHPRPLCAQLCQEEPEDPSRSRFSLILDPSRPRFSMILGTFCKYFKRCFAHCVRPPTCSFDASGQRFSFILVPFPAYFHHVLYMIPEAFCMPCACSFNLSRNRLDLDLVLRRSIGEAFSIRRPPCGARAC